jgi:hypothetical protein
VEASNTPTIRRLIPSCRHQLSPIALNLSWGNLPGWKLALGLTAIAVLAAVLVIMVIRGAFRRIAAAFWTMAVTMFGLLSFLVVAALFSRGFQWVVATAPNTF